MINNEQRRDLETAKAYLQVALERIEYASKVLTPISDLELDDYSNKRRSYRIKVARTHIKKTIDVIESMLLHRK